MKRKYWCLIIALAVVAFAGSRQNRTGAVKETDKVSAVSPPTMVPNSTAESSAPMTSWAGGPPPRRAASHLESELITIYAGLSQHMQDWDKSAQFEVKIKNVMMAEPLTSLVPLLTEPDPQNDEDKKQHAMARVVGLKMFEVAVRSGQDSEAAAVLAAVAEAVKDKGEVTKNQHLDLESMVRTYFINQPALFGSEGDLRRALTMLGISLDDLRAQGLQTPYAKGIVVGLLTTAFSYNKLDDMKTWLTAVNQGN